MTPSRFSLVIHAALTVALFIALSASTHSLFTTGLDAYAAFNRFIPLFILPVVLATISWNIYRLRAGKTLFLATDEREAVYLNRFYKVGFWIFYVGCMFALSEDPADARQSLILFGTVIVASVVLLTVSFRNAWQDHSLEREALD